MQTDSRVIFLKDPNRKGNWSDQPSQIEKRRFNENIEKSNKPPIHIKLFLPNGGAKRHRRRSQSFGGKDS